MSTPNIAKLVAGLGDSSDDQLLQVVGLLDRLGERGAVDRLLDPVRARLAWLRPPRPLTLRRLLFIPFEDLLLPGDACAPGQRRIPRAWLKPCHDRVLAGLAPALVAAAGAEIEGRDMHASQALLAAGGRFWPAAAAIVERWATDAEADARQLAGIADLLALGSVVVPALWSLPAKPMGPLAPAAIATVGEVVRAARARGPGAVLWVLEVLLTRSESPDVILAPLLRGEFGLPTREAQPIAEELARARLSGLEQEVAQLAGAPPGGAASGLVQLVANLDALEAHGAAVQAERAKLGAVRDTARRIVGEQVKAALGPALVGSFKALAAGGAMDDAQVQRLEAEARDLRRLGAVGARLGIARSADALLNPHLDGFKTAILDPAKAGSGDTSGLLEQARLLEIIFGPDVATRLYKEARAARTGTAA